MGGDFAQHALDALGDGVDVLEAWLSDTMSDEPVRDQQEVTELADVYAAVEDARRRLALIGSDIARIAGQGTQVHRDWRDGTLPGGRTYQVTRSATRKAWNHEEWQHSVRRQLVAAAGLHATLVDPETGEEVNVYDLLARAQAVHGSTAPRVTALRALHMDPSDYCTEEPGPWAMRISPPPETGPGKQ